MGKKAIIPIAPDKLPRVLIISAILSIAIWLRFADLGKQGLFLDEAWSWAATHLNFPGLLQLSFSDPHPPLYYILLKLSLLVLPDSEFGLRALSAALSIASLTAVLIYVKSRWNTETMIYVGLLMALSPFDIYYSQEARMYTLLSFLWVVSYISLVNVIEGDKRFLITWSLTTIMMAWTHTYGIIIALTYIIFIIGYLLLKSRLKPRLQWIVENRPLISSTAIVSLGVLPPVVLLFIHSLEGAGGAWVPTPADLPALFLLWTSGLTPVRGYFLHSTHLTLPSLAVLPTSIWVALGMAIIGLPAIWGMYFVWRTKKRFRMGILLALTLIVVPVVLIFSYGFITGRRVWALKPFLGSAYLLYIWAGVGISSIKFPFLRKFLGITIMLMAAMSLLPYYATWQKSPVAHIFHSLPVLTNQDGIIIEPPYIAPLVFYYMDKTIPAYGIVTENENQRSLVRILYSDKDVSGSHQKTTCAELATTTNLWVYDYNDRTRDIMRYWPNCVTDKNLWAFQEDQWRQVNP